MTNPASRPAGRRLPSDGTWRALARRWSFIRRVRRWAYERHVTEVEVGLLHVYEDMVLRRPDGVRQLNEVRARHGLPAVRP